MIRTPPPARRQLMMGLAVVAVVVLSSYPLLRNRWAQDDVPLVLEDPRVQHIEHPWPIFSQAYWPAPFPRDLYRPLTTALIATEWKFHGGASFSYKAAQLTFYAACCIALLILALRVLAPGPAFGISLLFAVQPIHVEAVALAVNQAEVLVGLLCMLAVARYLTIRSTRGPTLGDAAFLGATTLVAAHFKETGLMLPGLLLAAELFVVTGPWRQRLRDVRPLFLVQVLSGVVVLAIRSFIQRTDLRGTFTAEALEHLTPFQRLETMLRVVPEWLRLFLWPASLQADYSPRAINPATTWGYDQWLGAIVVVLVTVLAVRLRRRAPAFTFGIAWVAIGIFPVSNVIFPTGIVLAERTLFLPSVGALIAVGAAMQLIIERASDPVRWRRGLVVATTAILVMGLTRSNSRYRTWYSSLTMWGQAVIDSPDGYRPRAALGSLLYRNGWYERGMQSYREAIKLWDRSPGPFIQLADWHRTRGECELAIPLYRRAQQLQDFAPARAALVACETWVGNYAEAKRESLEGMRLGFHSQLFRVLIRTADSAARIGAPAHTVRFPRGYSAVFASDTIPLPGVGTVAVDSGRTAR